MVGIPQYLQEKAERGEIDATPRRGPLETGYYAMKVTEVEPDTKADPGVNLTFEVTRGPCKGRDTKYNWFAFTEKAAWKMIQLFDATGYTYDSDFEELMDGEDEFIGYVEKEPQLKDPSKFQNNVREFIKLEGNEALLD